MQKGTKLDSPLGLLPGKKRGGRAYSQHSTYKRAILERDGYRCTKCGCGLGGTCSLGHAPVGQLDVAHMVAWADGGPSTPVNQAVLCHPCNQRDRKFKHGALMPDQFFARLEAQVRS